MMDQNSQKKTFNKTPQKKIFKEIEYFGDIFGPVWNISHLKNLAYGSKIRAHILTQPKQNNNNNNKKKTKHPYLFQYNLSYILEYYKYFLY